MLILSTGHGWILDCRSVRRVEPDVRFQSKNVSATNTDSRMNSFFNDHKLRLLGHVIASGMSRMSVHQERPCTFS